MSNDKLAQFADRKYLNLESYRKNGQGVRTPLWFAENNGVLYFYTVAHSYKVKRIGANPRVRVAPCDMRGNVKGEWVEATARRLDGQESRMANELLDRKYGLAKRILNFLAKIRGHQRAAFAIQLISDK
ncbi:MAG TPA: PPOX class F420-dependent oxidoreductase [Blastocatellia bacterium]|nr:PPOX class F420-dependent oxidoreductase [Blastocatellia bacterium]